MQNASDKKRGLSKAKLFATSLLLAAILLFILASLVEDQYLWAGFVRATAEASMVGAIADWFAVTALFRHPLGLKIPHTAIIPTRKDFIGDELGRFVREKFLAEEVIAQKLQSMALTRRMTGWLVQPQRSAQVAEQLAIGVEALTRVMRDEDLQALIEERLVAQIRSTQLAPLVGNILDLLTSGNRQQELFSSLVKFGSDFLKENKAVVTARIKEELPRLIRITGVDATIYKKIVDAVDVTLQEVSADPAHPLQASFNMALRKYIEELKSSPEILAKEAVIKEELLQHELLQAFSTSLWVDIKTSLLERGSQSNDTLRQSIQQMLVNLGRTLLDDAELYRKVDSWVQEIAIYLTKTYGYEVESLIATTIHNWDAQQASSEIELQVGKDLQYIRVNGTLIGGLVGLTIHTLSVVVQLF